MAPAYNNLGVTLEKQENYEKAISAYEKALNFPDDKTTTPTTPHTQAHNNLGLLLQFQGELEDAIINFKRATQIDPDYAFARNNLQEAERQLALQKSLN